MRNQTDQINYFVRHTSFLNSGTLVLCLLAVALPITSCLPKESKSTTTDIFSDDEGSGSGNERRHKAGAAEIVWTIDMGRCTGHLISPQHMMTAAHCQVRVGEKFTSGYAQSKGTSKDLRITEVIEQDKNLDYSITRISWTNGYPKEQKFPPLIATKQSDINVSSTNNQGDELYTVGYPTDKRRSWGATYSQGRAKQSGDRLFYNVGTINGNSGGGVWRKEDSMLVSLTNGGSNAFGQRGWNRNRRDSPSHWNFGAGMWSIYEVSVVLKDIFPNGKNRFYEDVSQPPAVNQIFAAISVNGDTAKILLSAPTQDQKPSLYLNCEFVTLEGCDEKISTVLISEKSERKFYETESAISISEMTIIISSGSKNSKIKITAR